MHLPLLILAIMCRRGEESGYPTNGVLRSGGRDYSHIFNYFKLRTIGAAWGILYADDACIFLLGGPFRMENTGSSG